MILHALYDYYQRKSADPDAHMAPPGFEWKEIPFVIEIDAQGNLVQIEDTREGEGKKKRAHTYLVPQGVKKSSGVVANLFWENAEYVFGFDTKGKPERVAEQHQAFVNRIESLPEAARTDAGVQAVLRFLKRIDVDALARYAAWPEIVETKPNLTFRLHGNMELVCQRPVVVQAISSEAGAENSDNFCLVTGENDEVERLHTSIKGVWGAQTAGANIVSFNLDAFNSFGKAQGTNAPVGKRAAFGYTTALNHLLRRDSTQRMQVGDSSTVFWADKPTELEASIVNIFSEAPKDDPDRNVRAVASLYKSIDNGLIEKDEGKTRFFVLGLAPNAARIAIRFWHNATVAELAERIRQHFDDLAIVRAPHDPPYPTLFRLLVSVATQGKAESIPPNLSGELMRSVLAGLPYPQTVLAAVVRRIRAEQSKKDDKGHSVQNVTYVRAALIKACINRAARYPSPNIEEELTVSLDENNTKPGYRLGRLFAVLERIQEEANGKATIRERYYGAASGTPVTVFPTLLKLKNHYIAKLENKGRAINLEKLIGVIMQGIDEFPSQLPLQDQGRFAIGYYHQKQHPSTYKAKGE